MTCMGHPYPCSCLDIDVLVINDCLNDNEMLLKCHFAEELHMMAGLTIISALKGFILHLREENMTGSDPIKLVNTVDCHEEPNRPFSLGGFLSTYIHAQGGGEGLTCNCHRVDGVGGLEECRTSRLDKVGSDNLST